MFTEYVHAPLMTGSRLSDEERFRMSERNRGAASHMISAEPPQEPRPAGKERRSRRKKAAEPVKQPAYEAEDEYEAMLARMEQTERNRRAANGETDEPFAERAAAERTEEAASDTQKYEEYEDEFDSGRSHAATVARNSLRREVDFRRGWYLTFPFISGSSALQPAAEQTALRAPETAEGAEPEARAAADSVHTDRSGRQKVSGGRYSDYSRFGGYQRRITTGGPIIIGLLTVLLIGCVIYGKVQTNEVYTEIASLQSEYDDITARNISMKSEMEGKLTVKNIEDYAKNVLGLRPLDQSQIEYIQIQTEDEVVITKPERNFIVTVNDYLTAIWEFLRGA